MVPISTVYIRTVTYSAIKVPLLIHYSITTGRIAPFVRAGVAGTVPFNTKYSISFPRVYYASSELTKLTVPFVVAGGLEAVLSNKLRGYVEARYEFPSSVFGDRQLETRVEVSRLAFLVGVGF